MWVVKLADPPPELATLAQSFSGIGISISNDGQDYELTSGDISMAELCWGYLRFLSRNCYYKKPGAVPEFFRWNDCKAEFGRVHGGG